VSRLLRYGFVFDRESTAEQANEVVDRGIVRDCFEEQRRSASLYTVLGDPTGAEPPATLGFMLVQADESSKLETYDNDRERAHEDKTVEREYPNRILPFDNPLGDCNANAELLLAIGMTILLQVLANSLVCQARQSRVLAERHKSIGKVKTYDLYALVSSTKWAETSSMVWLIASFTLSGWLTNVVS
jgi:hypothetical protein